jgi:hypothetical protein
MDLKEIKFEDVDRIQLVHDRIQWQTVMNTVIINGFHNRRRIS